MRMSRSRAATIVASGLAAGLVIGGGYMAFASDGSGEADSSASVTNPTPPTPTSPPRAGEPVTIGPWADGKPAPDLIPIDLEDGRSGYLRSYDMAHGSQNPKFQRQISEDTFETVLPVYAKDGQSVIGEFVAGTATSRAE